MLPRWLRSARHLLRLPEVWRCSRRVRGWWHTTQTYLGLRSADYPLDFDTRAGVRLQLADFHELVTAWVVYCREEYRVAPDARVILDVGANYGAFTLLAASRAPQTRVLSLEPFPAMYQRLTANVAAHRLEGRVTCWPVALAATTGTRRFEADPTLAAPSNFGLLAATDNGVHQAIEVPTISWADLLKRVRAETGAEQIDLVKMDIEGAEHEVLPDLPPQALAGVRAWQMEYHPDRPKGPLFAALERAGLRCVRDQIAGPDSGVAHFARNES